MQRVLALCALLLACLGASAQGVLPVPELSARVIDQTNTLDPLERKGLEEKLANFEQQKGSQIVVLMVPTTQPEDIASYANRIANAWKIGRKEVGDGILVIVAKNDHRVRIEVAKTLEGAVPDLAASRIIEDAMTPRFRQGDFAGGLQAGLDQLIGLVNGEPLPAPKSRAQQQHGQGGVDFSALAIFLFVVAPLIGLVLRGLLGRPFGSLLTGGGVGLLALLFTSSLVIAIIAGVLALLLSLVAGFGSVGSGRRGWGSPVMFPGGGLGGSRGGGFGGGGWGGGSGGGFSSGGGGDFGGGGASGSW